MRTVTLYHIGAVQRAMEGSWLEMFYADAASLVPTDDPNTCLRLLSKPGQRVLVPVRKVVVPGHGSQYVAMAPEVQAMLEAPLRAEHEAHLRLLESDHEGVVARWSSRCTCLEAALYRFNSAPWWKRLLMALKGGL